MNPIVILLQLQSNEEEVIDLYINLNKKIKILIYWLNKIFRYLDGIEIGESNTLVSKLHLTYQAEVKLYII
jgi:hypothetical protein